MSGAVKYWEEYVAYSLPTYLYLDTFNINVVHVGILVFPHENECSFDIRFRKYVDILTLLLRMNYTRFTREDNIS